MVTITYAVVGDKGEGCSRSPAVVPSCPLRAWPFPDVEVARPACDTQSRGHRRWRSSRSYFECWRRAAISSSLFIAERPSISSSLARSRSSSTLRSS